MDTPNYLEFTTPNMKAKTKAKTNLLVFLRPTVIRSEQDAEQVTQDKYNQIWEVEILTADGQEMEVEIDAQTGNILEIEAEDDDDDDDSDDD